LARQALVNLPGPKTPSVAQRCDELAANPYDQKKSNQVQGVSYKEVQSNGQAAIEACTKALDASPGELRLKYQLARAYQATQPKKAFELYTQLVQRDYPAAYDNLGWLFLDGRAVSVDEFKATTLFRKGARLDDPDSMLSLGWMIMSGKANPEQYDEAAKWLRRAAALGHKQAFELLSKSEESQRPSTTLSPSSPTATDAQAQKMFFELFNTMINQTMRGR
jgi:TPR repeat protein